MESKKVVKIVVDNFSSGNFQKIIEENEIIKKICFQEPDENFGSMADFLNYLKICDNNQLKICIRETNLISNSTISS